MNRTNKQIDEIMEAVREYGDALVDVVTGADPTGLSSQEAIKKVRDMIEALG